MKKPWDTWVLKGLSINEAAPLFEKIERMQMTPWEHAFGWKNLTLADGRKVKLTIQKNGVVPIYTAIASDGVLIFDLLYYDSGYLNIMDLEGDLLTEQSAFPALYQSGRTTYLHQLGGFAVEQIENEPPSHWYDPADYTAPELAQLATNLAWKKTFADKPRLATGKYRLYQQAKRGLPLTPVSLDIEDVNNSIDLTTGLYMDSAYVFWKVDITARSATPTVTFTRFDYTGSENQLKELRRAIEANYWNEALILETYVLASLTLSAESYAVPIKDEFGSDWEYPSYAEWAAWSDPGQTYSLAEPISQGWKFNWNGNKAAVVVVQSLTARAFYANFFLHNCNYRSHVLELTFSITRDELDNVVAAATIESLETNDWAYSHGWQYWIWRSQAGSVFPFFVRDHPDLYEPTAAPPSDTPIYCYYTGGDYRNNTLSITRISVTPEDAEPYYVGGCGDGPGVAYGFLSGSMVAGSPYTYRVDNEAQESAAVGTTIISKTQAETTIDYSTSAVPSGAWSAGNLVITGSTVTFFIRASLCDALTPISWTAPPEYFDVSATQSDYYISGNSQTNSYQTTNQSGCRVVIPWDNAESVIIATYDNTTTADKTETRGYPNQVGGVRYDSVQGSRNSESGVISETLLDQPYQDGWQVDITSTSYTLVEDYQSQHTGIFYIFGKSTTPEEIVQTATAGGDQSSEAFIASAPYLLSRINSVIDAYWDIDFSIIQGTQPELAVQIDCTEGITEPEWALTRSVFNGYPDELAVDIKTAPIGFA